MMNRLLVLDLDGTLVDSRQDIANSLNHALKQEGFATLAQEVIEKLVGWGAKQLVQEALGNPSAEELQRVFVAFCEHYDEHLLDHTQTYPGAVEFLEQVQDWEKALITNKPQGFSEKIIQGLELHSHFRWIIGGDTLPVRKPHPQTLAPIQTELGQFSQGIIVGDSIVDIEFGKAAGLLTCAVTHGFGLRHDLEAAQPDYLVEDLSEVGRLPLFQRKGNP